ncbi:MAG TPA: trimeric intracellular cation channel family protein [Paludibacteraceae bacterium]|nr:trimeric intracellular cation channel family protein [Paludibacteraceae bacterium]
MNLTFINIIDYLGTFAFAISGMRLASAKRFDWFGAYVVGLVTAIGGGTTRDLLLDLTPFWMLQSSYLVVTGFALLFVIFLGKYVIRLHNTFFIFDAIGLGLFVVVGIDKTLELGFPFWVAILMGMITGSVGGVIRDILINEVPLIFRKDIYALACVVGGVFYFICFKLNFSPVVTQTVAAISVILTRILAVKYHISLPVLKAHEDFKKNKED